MKFSTQILAAALVSAGVVNSQGLGGVIGSITSGAASVGTEIASGATGAFGTVTSGAASVATDDASSVFNGITSTIVSGGSSIAVGASTTSTVSSSSATQSASQTNQPDGALSLNSNYGWQFGVFAIAAVGGAALL